MKFFLLIFLIPLVAKSQNLNVDRTLAYINTQLNDKNNKFYNESSKALDIIWGNGVDVFFNIDSKGR